MAEWKLLWAAAQDWSAASLGQFETGGSSLISQSSATPDSMFVPVLKKEVWSSWWQTGNSPEQLLRTGQQLPLAQFEIGGSSLISQSSVAPDSSCQTQQQQRRHGRRKCPRQSRWLAYCAASPTVTRNIWGAFLPLCSPISILRDRLCFQLGPLFNLTLIFNLQYLKELLLHVIFGSTSLVRCLLRCYREHIFYALLICVCTWLWCLLSFQE